MMDAAGAAFDSAIGAKEYDGGGMVTQLHVWKWKKPPPPSKTQLQNGGPYDIVKPKEETHKFYRM